MGNLPNIYLFELPFESLLSVGLLLITLHHQVALKKSNITENPK